MTTATPDSAVATALDELTSPVALTLGANLFLGLPDPTRHLGGLSVWVTATGGPSRGVFIGSSTFDDSPSVQVLVRAERLDFANGEALAVACLKKMRTLQVASATPPTGYSGVSVRESQPTYLGLYTDEGAPGAGIRHRWTFNVDFLRVDSDS